MRDPDITDLPPGEALLPYDRDEWERRLAEARARRQEVLARRASSEEPPTVRGAEGRAVPAWLTPALAALGVGFVAGLALDSVASAMRGPSAEAALVSRDAAEPLAGGVAAADILAAEEALSAAPALPAPDQVAMLEPSDAAPWVPATASVGADAAEPPAEHSPPEVSPRPATAAVDRAVAAALAEAQAEGQAEEGIGAVAGAVTADGPEAAAAPLPEGTRVVVQVPRSVSAGERDETLALLRNEAWPVAPAQTSRFTIDTTHVRFYHAADRPAAERLAGLVGGESRDFTAYRPAPATGLLELWVAGESPGGTRYARRPVDPGQAITHFLEELSAAANRTR